MSKSRKFENLPRPVRVLLSIGGLVDGAMRAYALVDIAKRDDNDVNGPKPAWVVALSVVSSFGLVPLAYLIWGRKD